LNRKQCAFNASGEVQWRNLTVDTINKFVCNGVCWVETSFWCYTPLWMACSRKCKMLSAAGAWWALP